MNRPIKFRAWNTIDNVMVYDLNSPSLHHGELKESDYIFMQFTGLHDNSSHLKEIYEGDIIDAEGKLKGTIYESPQVYEKGTDCLIEGMGTKAWRNTESIAVGRGCKYTQ